MTLSLIWHPKVQFTNPAAVPVGRMIGPHYEGELGKRWTLRQSLRWGTTHGKGGKV